MSSSVKRGIVFFPFMGVSARGKVADEAEGACQGAQGAIDRAGSRERTRDIGF